MGRTARRPVRVSVRMRRAARSQAGGTVRGRDASVGLPAGRIGSAPKRELHRYAFLGKREVYGDM